MPITKKILFVDDEKAIRDVTGIYLLNYGLEYIMASSGEEAISLLEDQKDSIDIVLLDLMMPGMSGYDVLCYIEKEKITIPVVVQTGVSDIEDLKRASDRSKEILFKPYPISQLVDVIEKYRQSNN